MKIIYKGDISNNDIEFIDKNYRILKKEALLEQKLQEKQKLEQKKEKAVEIARRIIAAIIWSCCILLLIWCIWCICTVFSVSLFAGIGVTIFVSIALYSVILIAYIDNLYVEIYQLQQEIDKEGNNICS